MDLNFHLLLTPLLLGFHARPYTSCNGLLAVLFFLVYLQINYFIINILTNQVEVARWLLKNDSQIMSLSYIFFPNRLVRFLFIFLNFFKLLINFYFIILYFISNYFFYKLLVMRWNPTEQLYSSLVFPENKDINVFVENNDINEKYKYKYEFVSMNT